MFDCAAALNSSNELIERDAFAAIGTLGRRELDAVNAWIALGCEGPQPQPDAEVQRVLAERLADAIEATSAARRAADRCATPDRQN